MFVFVSDYPPFICHISFMSSFQSVAKITSEAGITTVNLGELSHACSLHIYLRDDHTKDEHVMFELEGGDNYLAQVTQCMNTVTFSI